jgi:hypothetical protein
VRTIIPCAIAAGAAIASLHLFLADVFRMGPRVLFSTIGASLLLLWLVLCYLERARQRQLQSLREGLDRLGSGVGRTARR